MKTLAYLCYGSGPHYDELVFSVLSAVHRLRGARTPCRIVVYTDTPGAFHDLPVQTAVLSEQTLKEWTGPFGYQYRRKILVVKDALERFGGRLLFVDCDTYFARHPDRAFAAVRPGHTLMHIAEYCLRDRSGWKLAAGLLDVDLRDLSGRRWQMTPTTAMFNSGVIGLHESALPLLDEVIHLNDEIYSHVPLTNIEQFAFSVCLSRHTRLHQAYRVVHHYWHPAEREPFHRHLAQILHDETIASPEERFRRLWPHRPGQGVRARPFKRPVKTGVRAEVVRALHWTAKSSGLLGVMKVAASAARRRQRRLSPR